MLKYVEPRSEVKPATTTLPALRVVDAHSLPNRKVPVATRACDAADVADGITDLQNLTNRLIAMAHGVSLSSLAAALRLTPAQRDAVRRGERPLVLPVKSAPLSLPRPAVAGAEQSVEQRLKDLATEMGVAEALEMLVKIELSSAA
jgi:hypothetical protein